LSGSAQPLLGSCLVVARGDAPTSTLAQPCVHQRGEPDVPTTSVPRLARCRYAFRRIPNGKLQPQEQFISVNWNPISELVIGPATSGLIRWRGDLSREVEKEVLPRYSLFLPF
jgi:hypothetical protein